MSNCAQQVFEVLQCWQKLFVDHKFCLYWFIVFLLTNLLDWVFFFANLAYYAIWKEVDCFGLEMLEFAIVGLNCCTAKCLMMECGRKDAIFICLQICFHSAFIVLHYTMTESCLNKWKGASPVLSLISPEFIMFVFAKWIGWICVGIGLLVYHHGTRCFRYTPLALSQV